MIDQLLFQHALDPKKVETVAAVKAREKMILELTEKLVRNKTILLSKTRTVLHSDIFNALIKAMEDSGIEITREFMFNAILNIINILSHNDIPQKKAFITLLCKRNGVK